MVSAFFEEEDLTPGLRELGSDDRAARTGADDDDFGVVLFPVSIVAVREDCHGARTGR
jgi:hypothetical protein